RNRPRREIRADGDTGRSAVETRAGGASARVLVARPSLVADEPPAVEDPPGGHRPLRVVQIALFQARGDLGQNHLGDRPDLQSCGLLEGEPAEFLELTVPAF